MLNTNNNKVFNSLKKIFLTSSVGFVAKDIIKRYKIKGRLAFITTASEPKSEGNLFWQDKDRDSLKKAGFEVFDYTITDKKEKDLRNDLKDMDIIYVSGGNTFYLLEKIKESHFDKVIKDFIKQGKVYIGTSAGSIVAGPDIYPVYCFDNPKEAKKLKNYKGLGLVDFTVLPHWGSEYFKKEYLNKELRHIYRKGYKLILLNDDQYIAIVGDGYKIIDIIKDKIK